MPDDKTITFPVEATHIMMFARSIGDYAPEFHDADAAKDTDAEGIIAPPTFPQAVAQFNPDYHLRIKPGEPWFGSGKNPSGIEGKPASAGGLHAEQHFEFERPLPRLIEDHGRRRGLEAAVRRREKPDGCSRRLRSGSTETVPISSRRPKELRSHASDTCQRNERASKHREPGEVRATRGQ